MGLQVGNSQSFAMHSGEDFHIAHSMHVRAILLDNEADLVDQEFVLSKVFKIIGNKTS